MSVEVTIICDDCGTVFAGGKTAAEARASVKTSDARVGLPGGRDLCWECAGGARQRATVPRPQWGRPPDSLALPETGVSQIKES